MGVLVDKRALKIRLTIWLFTIRIALWNLRNVIFSSCGVSSLVDEFMNHESDRLTMLKSRFSCLPRPDAVANSIFTYLSTCSRDGPSTYTLISKRISLLSSLFSSFLSIMKVACWVWQRSVSCICILRSKLWSRLTINFITVESGADTSWVSEVGRWVESGENSFPEWVRMFGTVCN